MKKPLSIIVTVYQKERQIGTLIQGIVHNTTTPFQLVMVYDGCTDKSELVVNHVLSHYSGFMRELKVVYTPDVNEVRANNAGMKAADGDYLVLVQDDMWIVERGWERRLLLPLQTWEDVFAVSARNAHSFFCSRSPDKSISYTCTMDAERDIFRIRDGVNRGPIALCAKTMKELDYLDERFAPLYFDEMDLCVRAYRKLSKVCGIYEIVWRNLHGTTHVSKGCDVELSTGGTFNEACEKNRSVFWDRHHDYLNRTSKHDQDRPLTFEPENRLVECFQTLPDSCDYVGQSIDLATLHNRLGMELLSKGNKQAAFVAFTKSVEIEPHNVTAYTHLGTLYWANGDTDNALECLINGLRVKPHSRRLIQEIVRIFTELKKIDGAESLLRLYLAYDPCDKEMANLYEKLYHRLPLGDQGSSVRKEPEQNEYCPGYKPDFVSQIGQDKWIIEDVFKGKKNGFFLDFGAFDGVTISNTYVLEKDFGWRGICIEPSTAFSRLQHNRKCICDPSCLADKEKSVLFLEKSWDSGISEHFNKGQGNGGHEVRTTPLVSVLKKYNAPPVIDYCSIDVEGSEYNILKNFPFHQYIFLALTVEHNGDNHLRNLLTELLTSNGYLKCLSPGIEDWYLHVSIAESVTFDGKIYAERYFELWHKMWGKKEKIRELEMKNRHMANSIAELKGMNCGSN